MNNLQNRMGLALESIKDFRDRLDGLGDELFYLKDILEHIFSDVENLQIEYDECRDTLNEKGGGSA